MKPALLLDFGEVLISLNPESTSRALEALWPSAELGEEKELFAQYERGQLGSDQFLDLLGAFYPRRVSKRQLAEAWNALLLDVPKEKMEWLHRWKRRYSLYLVSNTNDLHLQAIRQSMGPWGWKDFTSCFDHLFFSHELGFAKPEAEFYQGVLETIDRPAHECLMVDDKPENLVGAELLGIRTILYVKNETSFEEVDKVLKRLSEH